jgi:hypothetical protein
VTDMSQTGELSGSPDTGVASAPPSSGVRPLDKLTGLLRKYVVMTEPQYLVMALWIVHTHGVEQFEQTPYVTVTSPERQCGKSRLMELTEFLVPRPWYAIMPSEAVVYRKIEAEMPTMLLDEVDAIFAPRTADRFEPLRAMLNAGFRRTATVDRAANFGNDLVQFNVYCAKMLAGIGVLPATITDRAVPIRLQRKRRDEKVAKFSRRQAKAECEPIRAAIAAWMKQPVQDGNGVPFARAAVLGVTRPEMPEQLSDRMQEGCEPLVAIADALGYGAEAREALVAIFSEARADEKESAELTLLGDIRAIFEEHGQPAAITTEMLLGFLKSNGNGWQSWYGRGLDARDLGTLLKPYGVKAVNVKVAGAVKKGWRWDHLHPAFERYLPEPGTVVAEVADALEEGDAAYF